MKLNKYLVLKFLLALGCLWLCQLMFGLFNPRIFHLEQGEWLGLLWGNVRFGLATVSALLLPYLALMLFPSPLRSRQGYRIVCETLYIVAVMLIILPNITDCAYYQFTYRRMSNEILGYLTIGGDMGNLAPLFVRDYWPVVACGVALIVLFLVVNHRLRLAPRALEYNSRPQLAYTSMVVGLLLCLVMVRGGVGRRCIQLEDASRYCQMKNSSLVNNSTYCILRTLGTDDIEERQLLDSDEARRICNTDFASLATRQKEDSSLTIAPMTPFGPSQGRTVAGQPKNIVVIVLESFSQEYMGCYNNGIMESFTPFLDSLSQRSLLLNGHSNGKKSIDAIPAIFAGIPSLQEMPFIMCDYYDDSIVALPQILQTNGYHTAFFHGGYNGSMNFDKFCQKAGFQEYYGRNEYGNEDDYDHAWGIFDEPFLQFAANTFRAFPEPFFCGIFTISSHHPYGIPEQHKGEFKVGSHPLLQCVNYTDFALRQFFARCQKEPWYKNTLFLIMADHPGQGLHREYNDYDGWYDIPLIVFDPNSTPTSATQQWARQRVVQQIDIMPTLLDYLGIEGHYVCLGQSLWQRSHDIQVAYSNNFYQILMDNQVAALSGERQFGDEEQLRYLKALLQVYSERMRGNHMASVQ